MTLPNGLGTDSPGVEEAEVTGVSPNELTTTGPGTEDPFVGTPFHKHVPARVERVAT